MHNLLPEKYKNALSRDYLVRLFTVLFTGVAVVFLMGAILLLPSYGYISARLEATPREEVSSVIEKMHAEENSLLITKDMLSLLSAKSDNSDINLSFVVARARLVVSSVSGGGIELLSVSYAKESGDLSIKGSARTRDALLSLGKALKADSVLGRISVPVELLAKSKNISFELRGKIKMP